MRTSPGHLGSVEEDSTRWAVVTAAGDTRGTVSLRRFTSDQFEEGIAPESTRNGPLALASHEVQKQLPQRFGKHLVV